MRKNIGLTKNEHFCLRDISILFMLGLHIIYLSYIGGKWGCYGNKKHKKIWNYNDNYKQDILFYINNILHVYFLQDVYVPYL